MKKKVHLPFQNMTRETWLNLAITAAISFYIIQIGFIVINGRICQNIGSDYCAYWSAGKIINESGFSDVYNLNRLRQAQIEVYSQTDNPNFQVFGVMYLPIFVFPFKYFSLLKPTPSYLVWTFINLSGFILYLTYFAKKTVHNPLHNKILLLIFLSLPFFANFHEGQVNIWLMICAGEFVRAILTKNHFKAGLWLGGWLLKPQLLILIIPFILFQRLGKIFWGFLISSGLIFLISFGLTQGKGFLNLINLFLEAGSGAVTSNPAAMMNWRMIGWHISTITSPPIGWTFIIVSSIITVFASLYILARHKISDSNRFIIAILGIFAATCAITWHSHLHMAMVLIPPLIYLKTKGKIDNKLFFAWVFAPILSKIIGYVFALVFQSQNLRMLSFQAQTLSTGLPGFILNLLILFWVIKQYPHSKEQALK